MGLNNHLFLISRNPNRIRIRWRIESLHVDNYMITATALGDFVVLFKEVSMFLVENIVPEEGRSFDQRE